MNEKQKIEEIKNKLTEFDIPTICGINKEQLKEFNIEKLVQESKKYNIKCIYKEEEIKQVQKITKLKKFYTGVIFYLDKYSKFYI